METMTVFPAPYPEEILYSVLARYQHLFDFPAARSTAVTAFGSRNAVAVVDFPSGLGRLIARLPGDHPHTAASFVQNHTLLPYYAPFLRPDHLVRARQVMEASAASRLRVTSVVGLTHAKIRAPEHLLYCPACAEADRNAVGEAYWHRVHQLPGVFVCPEHGCVLWRGQERRSDLRQMFVYHALEACLGAGIGSPLVLPKAPPGMLARVAEASARLLALSSDGTRPAALKWPMVRCLRTGPARVTRRGRGVRWDQALTLVVNGSGAAFLEAVLTDDRCTKDARWLSRMLTTQKDKVAHPLRTMLVAFALGLNLEDLFRKAAEEGDSQWRRGSYYRVGLRKRRHSHYTVDWAKRDADLLLQAQRAVSELLLSPERPERLTTAAIARRTTHRVAIQQDLDKLPRTAAYLDQVREDLPAYRRRRLAWVAGRFASERVVPFPHQLFERAGLLRRENPELESDAADHMLWLSSLIDSSSRVLEVSAA